MFGSSSSSSSAVKTSKSPLVNGTDDRPKVMVPSPASIGSLNNGTSPLSSPHHHHRTPTNFSKSDQKARRIRSLLRKIQFCILVLFGAFLVSTVNVARLSGKIMDAVDEEVSAGVQDGRASVLATLQRFKNFKKQTIKSLVKDLADDDQYIKIKKEDYYNKNNKGGGNLKGSTTSANDANDVNNAAAKEMEGGGEAAGDEMDQYKKKQEWLTKNKQTMQKLEDAYQRKPQEFHSAAHKKEKDSSTTAHNKKLQDLRGKYMMQHHDTAAAKGEEKPAAAVPALANKEEDVKLNKMKNAFSALIDKQKAPGAAAADAEDKKVDDNNNNGAPPAAKPGQPLDNIESIIAAGKTLRKAAQSAKDADYNPAGIPAREKRHYDNRWELSEYMPEWMKDYLVWQSELRPKLSETNWKDNKYLIMTCLNGQVCGNVAHRLRPIPAMLRVAYNTGRIFMIYWGDDDHKLETFLEPPHHGGLDWIVPPYMIADLQKTSQWEDIEAIDTQARNPDKLIVSTMVQDNDFAEPYYNNHLYDKQVTADAVFHDVFNTLFKPSAMLYERVEETHHTMGIFRGKFASVHIDYEDQPKTSAEKKALAEKVQNAMNCVSNLRPGGPFLVAAQTFAIASEAVKYAKKHKAIVAARQVAHDTATLPHDIWNSFLEIYFMANSRCVAYGKAGYGQLGYIMGYDYNCKIDYNEKQCTWTNTQEEVDALTAKAAGGALPHEQAAATDDDALHLHKHNVPKAKEVVIKGMPSWLEEWWKINGSKHESNELWSASKTMPLWMKAYLSWHKETKPLVTEDGWKDQRYLVLTCYAEQHCGNVPNRLRPLPAHLRVAAESQRLLLIHWDTPNHLDNFVVPPPSSIDWRVPEFMMWKVRASAQQNNMDILLAQSKQTEKRKVVNSMYNADDEGNSFYDDRIDTSEVTAEQVLHDVFNVFFQPTPELQKRITEMLDMVKLKPGEYSVAHIDDPRVPGSPAEGKHLYDHTEKALNCLSQIAPDQPYLILSETFEGCQMAKMVGRNHGVTIPAKQINHETHLIPRDLMGSFAEVYVASMGNCVSYNNGGFGRMAYALQKNFNCKIRYAGRDAMKCHWNEGTG